jgi:hypothetical protein
MDQGWAEPDIDPPLDEAAPVPQSGPLSTGMMLPDPEPDPTPNRVARAADPALPVDEVAVSHASTPQSSPA